MIRAGALLPVLDCSTKRTMLVNAFPEGARSQELDKAANKIPDESPCCRDKQAVVTQEEKLTHATLGRAVLVFAIMVLLIQCTTSREQSSLETALPLDLMIASGTPTQVVASNESNLSIWASLRIKNTDVNEVAIAWFTKGNDSSGETLEIRRELTAFAPTARCASRIEAGVIYIAGWAGNHGIVEKWTLGTSQSEVKSGRVGFHGSLTRTSIPIDGGVGPIQCICCNPWERGTIGERLWEFDWRSKEIDAIDLSSGKRSARVSSSLASGYVSMTLRRHSFFGIVCKLDRIPATAIRRSTRIVDEREVDELITFDQDCDGTMDGHFVIPVDLVHENPVFEAGVFIDDHP